MSQAAARVNVLAILPSPEDQTSLTQIFRHSHWGLHFADALGRAGPAIDELAVGVVISHSKLPDAGWQDVLQELQFRPLEPVLIVASRLADDGLWAEVLNLGGYDVLAIPFQTQEVIRSVSLAWRHWRDGVVAGRGKVMAAGSSARQSLS